MLPPPIALALLAVGSATSAWHTVLGLNSTPAFGSDPTICFPSDVEVAPTSFPVTTVPKMHKVCPAAPAAPPPPPPPPPPPAPAN